MFKKWLKVGMSDMQVWTEKPGFRIKQDFFHVFFFMYKIYDRVRKQFLQLKNLNFLILSILNFN